MVQGMSSSRLACLYVKLLSEILKLNCDNSVFLDFCGVNVAPLPPRQSWCLVRSDTMLARSCHGVKGKCTWLGVVTEKIRGSLKIIVTFQLTIDTWETLSERKRTWKVIASRFLRRIVNIKKLHFLGIFRVTTALCSRMFRIWVTHTVLTPIWWLPLFQVSGETRESDAEAHHLQETPRYNIPLSGTTRLDSLSSSVANGEFR